jgi:hypothetical protein
VELLANFLMCLQGVSVTDLSQRLKNVETKIQTDLDSLICLKVWILEVDEYIIYAYDKIAGNAFKLVLKISQDDLILLLTAVFSFSLFSSRSLISQGSSHLFTPRLIKCSDKQIREPENKKMLA